MRQALSFFYTKKHVQTRATIKTKKKNKKKKKKNKERKKTPLNSPWALSLTKQCNGSVCWTGKGSRDRARLDHEETYKIQPAHNLFFHKTNTTLHYNTLLPPLRPKKKIASLRSPP
jgi:hypothetical protein